MYIQSVQTNCPLKGIGKLSKIYVKICRVLHIWRAELIRRFREPSESDPSGSQTPRNQIPRCLMPNGFRFHGGIRPQGSASKAFETPLKLVVPGV